MLRLDTLTKDFPTYVGMSYAGWCYSYSDALGAPITEEYMNNRRKQRGRIGQVMAEVYGPAGDSWTGWVTPRVPFTNDDAARRVAISSRKGTFTFGSV